MTQERIQGFHNILNTTLKNNHYYVPDQIADMISACRHYFSIVRTWQGKWYDVPCAFDIETTSFYRHVGKSVEKCATMYEWTLGINGLVMIGRTWEEFLAVINQLQQILDLNITKRLVIYVQNLEFEFQFMRKWFSWYKVFCSDARKPIYAITDQGIEFRCSYILTGYSLETLSDDDSIAQYNVKKKVGDLDYSLIRHSKTPLSDLEIGYCIYDVVVVMVYIFEKIIYDGSIVKIPLTKTGYVRNYCRNFCYGVYKDGNQNMGTCTLQKTDEESNY